MRARPRLVGQALLKQTPVLSVLVAVPGVVAMLEHEQALAVALLTPAIGLAALGAWSRGVELNDDLRRIEAVVTLALIFVLSAVLCVPAFVVLGMPGLDAFFEATSGITTTGLSVARAAEDWPVSGHFLRAWMQWCGGVVVAVAGIALLIDAGRAARVMGRESVSGADYLASTRAKARLVLVGYTGLTVIGVMISIPLFPGIWEGPLIVLAAVSTGGFSPRDSSLADYSLVAQVFTFVLCIATSISLLFYAVALRRGPFDALRRGTVPVTLGIIAAGTVLYAVLHLSAHGGPEDEFVAGLLNHISAQTTAGFSTTPLPPASPVLFLMIVAMILGGDVGSTTGGIKTGRTMMLFRMVALVFLRLRMPDRAVSHLKIGARRADSEEVLLPAALLSIYLVTLAILSLAYYGHGHPALASVFDAVSALSGVGLSTGVIGPDLAPSLKTLTIIAMFLGRLEFFVLIALFLPSTWITRR